MRDSFPVVVESSYRVRWRMRNKLRKYGLNQDDPFHFSTDCMSDTIYKKVRAFCKSHHLDCRINTEFGTRNRVYRKTFFDHYVPVFKNKYFCAYCGRLLPQKKVTVDHLYPVHRVARDPKLQRTLKRQGIYDVNDIKNLVPACESCNKHKGKKLGKWIYLGRIGRNPKIWIVRHFLRVVILLAIILYLLYYHGGIEFIRLFLTRFS